MLSLCQIKRTLSSWRNISFTELCTELILFERPHTDCTERNFVKCPTLRWNHIVCNYRAAICFNSDVKLPLQSLRAIGKSRWRPLWTSFEKSAFKSANCVFIVMAVWLRQFEKIPCCVFNPGEVQYRSSTFSICAGMLDSGDNEVREVARPPSLLGRNGHHFSFWVPSPLGHWKFCMLNPLCQFHHQSRPFVKY